MDSFESARRQLRIAASAILIIFPAGIIGFMYFEGYSLFDAIWVTVVTLATVGYGDVVPLTTGGRIFTLVLIIGGIGAFALGAQAAIEFFSSPQIRTIRQGRITERRVKTLQNHYIIVGEGELVDQTIDHLRKRAQLRVENQRQAIESRVHQRIARLLGKPRFGLFTAVRDFIRRLWLDLQYARHRPDTILDIVVVVTEDAQYAHTLMMSGLLVIHDDPTDNDTLSAANISKARALMVMLENDSDALLTVLSARASNENLYITAATHGEHIARKIIRVGANNVLPPYLIAGRILNSTTLRPVVNDFFYSMLFDQNASVQIVQLYLSPSSHWIGRTLGELRLRDRFETGVIGIRKDYGRFFYVPGDDYRLQEEEIVLTVTTGRFIPALQADCCAGTSSLPDTPNWQRLPVRHDPLTSERIFSLMDAEAQINALDRHYLICGEGEVIKAALSNLNPSRPFVVVSKDHTLIAEMQKRGFLAVQGDPTHEETLERAGVMRALSIMISLVDDRAATIVTALNARALNRGIFIVVTAEDDSMTPRLKRAGADRIVNPFRIAAQFVLLATTRPVVSDFLQHILYNYETGIETTELYMQADSPYVGRTIAEIGIGERYQAWVIGIRQQDSRFVYAPPMSYTIQQGDVLIVVTPMTHADTIRLAAHGVVQRPPSLR